MVGPRKPPPPQKKNIFVLKLRKFVIDLLLWLNIIKKSTQNKLYFEDLITSLYNLKFFKECQANTNYKRVFSKGRKVCRSALKKSNFDWMGRKWKNFRIYCMAIAVYCVSNAFVKVVCLERQKSRKIKPSREGKRFFIYRCSDLDMKF